MTNRMFFATGLVATAGLTASLFAQPTVDADLGTLANPQVATGAVTGIAPTQVRWIKFAIPAVSRAAGQFLDITTNGGSLTGADSMIGLYDATGNRIATDDDDGPSA